MPTINTDRFLTTKQAGDSLNLPADTLRKYCQKGIFSGAILIADRWLIPKKDVETYRSKSLGKTGPKIRNKSGLVSRLLAAGYIPASVAAKKYGTEISEIIRLCRSKKLKHAKSSRTFYVFDNGISAALKRAKK